MTKAPGLVYTDVEYAAIHNDRGTISGAQTVKEHTRKGRTVRSHTRNVNMSIPKRQFMGPSHKLEQELEGLVVDLLDKAFI